ncbi:hypothetical protein [uncultured Microbacterium sp.]|uniref:hypothetical protein n=1 Tax=uncultured Microbacterium sp. TaxID=191216 RepID=UPI0025E4F7A5|nr:hypothetical protein [uncultured Microbacterium sp.]
MQHASPRPRALLQRIVVTAAALAAVVAPLTVASTPAEAAGRMTYTLYTEANPTADQADAYTRIRAAMDAAVARYNEFSDFDRHLNVYYVPGVPTAEASIDGTIRFGENRGFMQERTALHEISHTVGNGTANAWYAMCQNGRWTGANANAKLAQFDGAGAVLNCGGSHIWPYGLNYDNEMSDLSADRHVQIIWAMIADGM